MGKNYAFYHAFTIIFMDEYDIEFKFILYPKMYIISSVTAQIKKLFNLILSKYKNTFLSIFIHIILQQCMQNNYGVCVVVPVVI